MKDKTMDKNRRRFIKSSIAGLAGASLFPSLMKEKAYADEESKNKTKFIYRTLGKTGIKVPIVSMGVMNTMNPKLVEAAYNAGIVHFDTAALYGQGKSETMLGEFFKDKPRDSFVLATKISMPGIMFGNLNKNAKPQDFINEFEKSMKRLDMDYVDILYLHGPGNREKTLFEPYFEAIKQIKKQGRAKYIGVSTHQNQAEVIRAAIESKAYDVVLVAYNSTYPKVGDIKKAIAEGAKAGLGIIGMKTVAGIVGGGFGGPPKNPSDEEITAAIKWSLEDKNVHTIIPGWQTFDHINSTIAVMNNLKMTTADRALLNKRNQRTNLLCYQCEECLPQCPAGHHIPTLMRSYMYAHGYKNMQMARFTLDSLELKKIACEDCETCTVQCARNFNVKEKILDIARLRDVPMDFLV
ncbi:MAG: aldo/keto reductase [Desulfobacteraceae bacterium]|jgi:predicted aldo/keto reductase-like oxidoreductase